MELAQLKHEAYAYEDNLYDPINLLNKAKDGPLALYSLIKDYFCKKQDVAFYMHCAQSYQLQERTGTGTPQLVN